MTNNKQHLLIVLLNEDMRSVLTEALSGYECPYSYKILSTAQEVLNILAEENVQAIIMTKSAALYGDSGKNGIMTSSLKLPPTITLIQPGDGFPDYLYIKGAFNDWCTVPFSLDELFARLSMLLERADKSTEPFNNIQPDKQHD